MSGPVAIICGSGSLPLEAAREIRQRGGDVFLVGLVGSAGREIEAFPHLWVRLGELGKLFSALKTRQIQQVAFLGAVMRPDLGDLIPDWGAIVRAGEIAKLFRGGDDALMRGLVKLFEGEGFDDGGPERLRAGSIRSAGADRRAGAGRRGAGRHRFRGATVDRHVSVRHRAGRR